MIRYLTCTCEIILLNKNQFFLLLLLALLRSVSLATAVGTLVCEFAGSLIALISSIVFVAIVLIVIFQSLGGILAIHVAARRLIRQKLMD
jgi:hypothetical protein